MPPDELNRVGGRRTLRDFVGTYRPKADNVLTKLNAEPKATILVVDDDRLILLTVASELRRAGYQVIEADNGDDAILLARQHRPQLALLDMRMNGKSGLDVAGYLRDYVGTPFMFLSAFSDEALVRQARGFGALDYLVKPVDSTQIVPAIEAALDRSRRDRRAGGAIEVSTDVPVVPPPMPRDREDAPADAELVATAAGILMERQRIGRVAALARLGAIAAQRGVTREALAADLVRQFDLLNTAG